MADTCIVCLGDLRSSLDEDPPPDTTDLTADGAIGNAAELSTRANMKRLQDDEETIAHLLPCKHDLHNSCLKPWVERANSCPICRATFNMVELTRTVGGPILDSYAVQDKVQEAEVDASMIVEDELFAVEAWDPCIVCGNADETHERMYCDGCDKAIHVFCAGYDNSPDVWYCERCLVDFESEVALPGVASALRRQPRQRTTGAPRRRGRRSNDAIWARVWQEVSRRLDLDLEFPFDEESSDPRTEEQRREFRRWEERLQVASTQGATTRLRAIAATQLNPSRIIPQPAPESQEEIRAWNAFDKARESQSAPEAVRSRKRRATSSPVSPSEPEPSEQPQLKRPRLRRPPVASEAAPVAESSTAAAHLGDDTSTFLSSLLREVETKPASATSPAGTDQQGDAFSPHNSSPVRSPISSGYATPRQLSVTPPPQRPMSPLLSSVIEPVPSPVIATFSPFSPAAVTDQGSSGHRGRGRNGHPGIDARNLSPSRGLSYSAKEEVQRMVKLVLGPKYRDKEITKDQYTDINRDISRKMYELVGDASALANQVEREKWQKRAEEEVKQAIAALPAAVDASDEE